MDPAALQQFEQVVLALMSPDNTVRGQAEEAFNQAKQNPDALFTTLVTHLRKNSGEQARALPLPPLLVQWPSPPLLTSVCVTICSLLCVALLCDS